MLLLLTACPEVAEEVTEEEWVSPDQAGPWDAGTYEDRFTGTAGVELGVQVWYPAKATSDELYLYDDLISDGATVDATPACDGARPVVVFSHGHSAVRWQSTFLTEHLASQGFVVVAPDHTYNTAFDIEEERLGEVMLRRPTDVGDTFDWLTEVAAGPGGPLEGCADADSGFAMSGHSFGGFTTHAVSGAVLDVAASAAFCAASDQWLCSVLAEQAALAGVDSFDLTDDRVWAAVPMSTAGYEAFLGGLDGIEVPLLALGGDTDALTPLEVEVRPAFEGAAAAHPRYLGVLADAGHFTFSNACDWFAVYDECNPPYLPPEEAYPIINTAVSAFLRTRLGDTRAADWLPPEADALTWEAVP